MITICAIVLAAGESRRMGEHKVLLPFAGTTVIDHITRTLLASKVSDVTVVLGHQAEAVRQQLANVVVRTVVNQDYIHGMLSSVRCGLRNLPAASDAVLIALGDHPEVTKDVVNALVEGLLDRKGAILVPTYAGRRGHPLLLSARFIPEILTGFDDTGLRGLLREHADGVHEVPVTDSAVIADMNTPNEYQDALQRYDSAKRQS